MPDRRTAAPTTVVNWFTTGYHPTRASQELARTARFLRRQPGLDYLLRAQLATRPNVHLQLGYWRAHADFVAAVRQPAFATLMERLAAMDIDTRADQTVSVARIGLAPVQDDLGDAVGFLTEYLATTEHAAVERALRTQAESYLAWSGFGGIDLLRSIVRPSRYLSVSWWFDARQCRTAMTAAPAAPAMAIRVEHTRQLLCERAFPPG